MHYILLDLEWNQAYLQKALAVQKRLNARLRGEVIQIGAVKLDEKLNICGSYSTIVRPKYFTKIHRHVMLLTGITQEKIDGGMPLPEAIDSFKKFLGDDYAFLTWGPDDIPMLKENLNVNAISSEFITRVYDLQSIYGHLTDRQRKQISLEDAMLELGLEQTLPAHDALNDAYFTALVAQKLDMKRGISEYSENTGNYLFEKTVGDSDLGEVGYEKVGKPEDFSEHGALTCPICGEALTKANKTLHSKGQRYITLVECKEHGRLFLQLHPIKNFNGTYRIKLTLEMAMPEKIAQYEEKLKRASEFTKTKRRPRRSRAKSKTPAEA